MAWVDLVAAIRAEFQPDCVVEVDFMVEVNISLTRLGESCWINYLLHCDCLKPSFTNLNMKEVWDSWRLQIDSNIRK